MRLALLLAAMIALVGCGFEPLYAPTPGVETSGRVALPSPPGESGYVFRRELSDSLGEPDVDPPYRLDVTLTESIQNRSVALDATVTSFLVTISARYTVVRVSDGVAVGTGEDAVITSYDTPASPFATVAARRDAVRRAAEELAVRIGQDVVLLLQDGD